MRSTQLIRLGALVACSAFASAQLVPFAAWNRPTSSVEPSAPPRVGIQVPVMAPNEDPPSSNVILSDVMARDRSINVFAGFTRDVDPVSSRLDNGMQNATVLAPQNTAISKMSRKPWEDPSEYDAFGEQAYEGQQGQDRAHANLRKFVESHILPQSPWKEGEKVKTLAGKELYWETKDGVKFIQPVGVEVVNIAEKVANGEVWVLKDILTDS